MLLGAWKVMEFSVTKRVGTLIGKVTEAPTIVMAAYHNVYGCQGLGHPVGHPVLDIRVWYYVCLLHCSLFYSVILSACKRCIKLHTGY